MVYTLKQYIKVTENIKKGNQLWLSWIKPHEPVGRQTISRWLKRTLKLGGIDTSQFSGHSTRIAATNPKPMPWASGSALSWIQQDGLQNTISSNSTAGIKIRMTSILLRQYWTSLNRRLINIFHSQHFFAWLCFIIIHLGVFTYHFLWHLFIHRLCMLYSRISRLIDIPFQHTVFLTFDCTLKIHVTDIYSKEYNIKWIIDQLWNWIIILYYKCGYMPVPPFPY